MSAKSFSATSRSTASIFCPSPAITGLPSSISNNTMFEGFLLDRARELAKHGYPLEEQGCRASARRRKKSSSRSRRPTGAYTLRLRLAGRGRRRTQPDPWNDSGWKAKAELPRPLPDRGCAHESGLPRPSAGSGSTHLSTRTSRCCCIGSPMMSGALTFSLAGMPIPSPSGSPTR